MEMLLCLRRSSQVGEERTMGDERRIQPRLGERAHQIALALDGGGPVGQQRALVPATDDGARDGVAVGRQP